ncbi:MAG: LysE family transporter [Bacteroidaceae bacterium]|nr:LysE family transporter [Bacteroidaceae bacterium]
MPVTLLPTLLLQILVIGYTPGPANIYSLAMSLRHGRKEALIMWTGLLCGFSIAVIIMALLTHQIGIAFGGYVAYFKYIGAAYILYLAYKIYTSKGNAKEKSGDCSFVSGMLVQLTNAKMLLFDLTAFSTFVLPYSTKLSDLLEVAAWLAIAGPGGNLVWLLTGSFMKPFFDKHRRKIDTMASIALVICALLIAL